MLKKILLTALSLLLLWLSWQFPTLGVLSVFVFVPLLLALHHTQKPFKALLVTGLLLLLYHLVLFLDLSKADTSFFLSTVLIHSFLQLLVFALFLLIKKQLGNQRAYLSLPFIWLLYESALSLYEFGLPMFNLGNVLASSPSLTQWYAFLGHSAGTIWIWFLNLSIFGLILRYQRLKKFKSLKGGSVGIILLTGIPMLLGMSTLETHSLQPKLKKVLTVKSDTLRADLALNQLNPTLKAVSADLDSSVELIILPNSLQFIGLNEQLLEVSPVVKVIRDFQLRHSKTPVYFQGTSLHSYNLENVTETAVPKKNGPGFLDIYRSHFLVVPNEEVQLRHQLYYPPQLKNTNEQHFFEQQFFTHTTEAQSPFTTATLHFSSYSGRDIYLTELVRQSQEGDFILLSENSLSPYTSLPLNIRQSNARIRAIENGKSVLLQTSDQAILFDKHGHIQNTVITKHGNLLFDIIPAGSSYYAQAGNLMERIATFIVGFIILFVVVKLILPKKTY